MSAPPVAPPPPPHSSREARALPRFVPPVTCGRVVKVYDGDTITIASAVPGLYASPVYKFTVRLRGVDTPELRSRDADEKAVAKIARDALRKLIMHEVVDLHDVELEKYGRMLCDVTVRPQHDAHTSAPAAGGSMQQPDKVCLRQWLLSNRLAVVYDGGTKARPTSWQAYHEGTEPHPQPKTKK